MIFYPRRLAAAEARASPCGKPARSHTGSRMVAPPVTGNEAPALHRRDVREAAAAITKPPPGRSVQHGGFVITSGGHRHPCLYRELTLAGFIPAVIRLGDRARFSRWLVLIAWPLPSSLSLRESAAVFPRCYLASDHRLTTDSVIVRIGCPVRPVRLS